MGWQAAYEMLAKLLKSGTHPQGSKPQEQHTESTGARDVGGNQVQIPNLYLGEARKRD